MNARYSTNINMFRNDVHMKSHQIHQMNAEDLIEFMRFKTKREGGSERDKTLVDIKHNIDT